MECEASSQVVSTTIASWPFDDLNAEVILRSSDNVDFRVFKCNLSLASPVFKDMFTLGALVHGEHPQNPYSLPEVLLLETSTALDALFRLVCPLTVPKLDSINDIKALLAAVVKYDLITPAIDRATNLITSQHLESKPLSLYAIACHYGWRSLAEQAARETLKINDLSQSGRYVAEFEDITAGDYHRLLEYHHVCATAAHETDIESISRFEYPDLKGDLDEDIPSLLCRCPKYLWDHQWFFDYIAATRKELLRRPDPSTVQYLSFLESSEYPHTICSRMPLHMSNISEVYAKAVEDAISKVKLDFKH